LDGSLFKPREIRNWSKDDMLSYTAHRRGKPALYASRTFLREAFQHTLRKNFEPRPGYSSFSPLYFRHNR
jgi:hypothetical protein